MSKYKNILTLLPALSLLQLVGTANAAIKQPPGVGISAVVTTVNGSGGVVAVICSIASWWLFFTMVLAVIFGVWAGWKYVFGRGEEKENTEARKMFQYALIGVVIGIVALGMPAIAGDFLGLDKTGSGACNFLP